MAAVIPEPGVFEVGGQSYTVALTTNGLCALEEQFGGRSISRIGTDIASGALGARGVRALFRSALEQAHPFIDDRKAGLLLEALGADEAGDLISRAFDRIKSGLVEQVDLPKPKLDGSLSFDAAGERLNLVFGMNAQAELEDYFGGLNPEEIGRKIAQDEITLRDLRAMFRAGVISDRDLSMHEAGALIDKVGIGVAGKAAAVAFFAAFPEAVKEAQPEAGNRRARRAAANPTRAKKAGGTGKR